MLPPLFSISAMIDAFKRSMTREAMVALSRLFARTGAGALGAGGAVDTGSGAPSSLAGQEKVSQAIVSPTASPGSTCWTSTSPATFPSRNRAACSSST
jgi:hypothetical protein